jgi:hypothetical protein
MLVMCVAHAQMWQVTAYYTGTGCRCPFFLPAAPNGTSYNGTLCQAPTIDSPYFCPPLNTSVFDNGGCYFCLNGETDYVAITLTSAGHVVAYFGTSCTAANHQFNITVGACTPIAYTDYDVIITALTVDPPPTIVTIADGSPVLSTTSSTAATILSVSLMLNALVLTVILH